MYVCWSDKYVLGNALIDTQHRMLMMLCRKLDIAIKTRQDPQAIQRVILEVKKFAEFHFVSEQNLMHEIGYPEVEAHSRLHNTLLLELQTELQKIRHGSEFPEDLLYMLNHWLMDHIASEDAKIESYLRSAAKRPIGDSLYSEFFFAHEPVAPS